MLRIKSGRYGARFTETQAICIMTIVVDQVLDEAGVLYEISSGIEGKHDPKSLHYPGHALDFAVRSRMTFLQGDPLRLTISGRLGSDFDVTYNHHKKIFHVEWQMKMPLGRL